MFLVFVTLFCFWFVVTMEFKECWPVAIPPCFTLKVTPVQTHSKTSTFYTPVSHILWFWCSTLHFHADPFTVYPVRIAFTIFNCFLISVLVHLNDLPFFYIFVFLIVIFPFPLDSSSLSFQPLLWRAHFLLSIRCQIAAFINRTLVYSTEPK